MTKNGVIIFGLIAAVLSQYAWLFPTEYAYFVFAIVAYICCLVALVWTLFETQ